MLFREIAIRKKIEEEIQLLNTMKNCEIGGNLTLHFLYSNVITFIIYYL